MMLICRIVSLFAPCGCRWCAFDRLVTEILEDCRLRQEAEPRFNNTHFTGGYR